MVALMQSLQGSQALDRDIAMEEIGFKRKSGTKIAHYEFSY